MVKKIRYLSFMENAYFFIDDKSGHGFLIDPGAKPETFTRCIRENGWTIESILLTHGHFDHIRSAGTLSRALNVPILALEGADDYLASEEMNLSRRFKHPMTIEGVQTLSDGETIGLAGNPASRLKVVATPGHTEDSAMYYSEGEGVAFIGDAMFKGSLGTWRYPGGDQQQLMRSATERILSLPAETVVYPGHASEFTVKFQKRKLDA